MNIDAIFHTRPGCPGGGGCDGCRQPAADLAASRAATAERTRADRLRAAGEALEKCGLLAYVEGLHAPQQDGSISLALDAVRSLISRLSDGSDEPRYAAAMTARRALGALWEVL